MGHHIFCVFRLKYSFQTISCRKIWRELGKILKSKDLLPKYGCPTLRDVRSVGTTDLDPMFTRKAGMVWSW